MKNSILIWCNEHILEELVWKKTGIYKHIGWYCCLLMECVILIMKLISFIHFSFCFAFNLIDAGINIALVLLQERLDESVVNETCSEGLGMEEVDIESKFEEIVEGDEGKSESDEGVEDSAETVDDPIGEPLLVIISSLGLECLETHVCGIEESNNVTDKTCTNIQKGKCQQHNWKEQYHVTWFHIDLITQLGQLFVRVDAI